MVCNRQIVIKKQNLCNVHARINSSRRKESFLQAANLEVPVRFFSNVVSE